MAQLKTPQACPTCFLPTRVDWSCFAGGKIQKCRPPSLSIRTNCARRYYALHYVSIFFGDFEDYGPVVMNNEAELQKLSKARAIREGKALYERAAARHSE